MTELFIHTYSPTSSEHEIASPQAESEFEVQAKIFWELKQRGEDVRGEVSIWIRGGQRCRFDLVVFRNGKAIHIVEVKDERRTFNVDSHESTRQPRKYRTCGVPVTFVYGMHGAREFLAYFDATYPRQIKPVELLLTREHIEKAVGICGITKEQADLLGVTWPTASGWKDRLINRPITVDDLNKLISLKRMPRKKMQTESPLFN